MNFFKERIEFQYPLQDTEDDPMLKQQEAHEAFMKSRSEVVLGRAAVLKQVRHFSWQALLNVPDVFLSPKKQQLHVPAHTVI